MQLHREDALGRGPRTATAMRLTLGYHEGQVPARVIRMHIKECAVLTDCRVSTEMTPTKGTGTFLICKRHGYNTNTMLLVISSIGNAVQTLS